jgi:hypothetical protein
LRGGQGGVEVRLREVLDAESEQEVVLSEDIDGVLADSGLAAASGTGDQHDLRRLERIEHLLHQRGTR